MNKDKYTNLFIGVLMLIVGFNIIHYGILRSLIQLGDERYLVGGGFVLFGIVILFFAAKSLLKK